MTLRIVVEAIPKGPGAVVRIPLSDRQTVAILRWLRPIENSTQLRVIDWIRLGYEALGGEGVTTERLVEWMVAHGWRTKSVRPASVVGSTLTNSREFHWREGVWIRSAPGERGDA